MTKLSLYNTKSRRVEEFYSQNPGVVKVYTCGPTVYNTLHIGNWLAYIRWDTLVRILKQNGYAVDRVTNITDVGHLVSDGDEGEDKLEVGAKREKQTAFEVAKRYEKEFYQGVDELGLTPADHYARATDYINEQIALIKVLDQKGYIYKISDGLYFDTSKFAAYSDFAKLDLKGQAAGSRIELNNEKKQPWDFAVWKFSPIGKKRDMEWESPWGRGFPGWHLECSAIALKILGETLDIHTGGIDHIPVHHTNEIAQSEAASGKTLANFWLHNNFLLINDTKLSKSLDNGLSLEDIKRQGYSPYDFKMMALQSHYRSEASFSLEALGAAATRLNELRAFAVLRYQSSKAAEPLGGNYFQKQQEAILSALNDDMNTPLALSLLSQTIEKTQQKTLIAEKNLKDFTDFIEFLDNVIGFDLMKLNDISQNHKELINDRLKARAQKDFITSDKLRLELENEGIMLSDGLLGTVWFYK